MVLHRDKSNSVPSRMGSILYQEHRNMLERAANKTWSVIGLGMVIINLYFVTV